MTQYQPSKLGCLAQALDEAIPEGVTGIDAAKAVADFLNECGWVIEPKTWRCDSCGKTFNSGAAKAKHRMDKHTPHLKLSAKDRPANLGPIPCGVCDQTFANEWNATQHRRMAHALYAGQSHSVAPAHNSKDGGGSLSGQDQPAPDELVQKMHKFESR